MLAAFIPSLHTTTTAFTLRFAAEHALPHAQAGDVLGVRKACCKLPFLVELFRGDSSFRVVLAMNRGASAQQNGDQVQLRGTKTTGRGEASRSVGVRGRNCVHTLAAYYDDQSTPSTLHGCCITATGARSPI